MQSGLQNLLDTNPHAAQYYASLHPSVRAKVDNRADSIDTQDDLISAANNAMTNVLREVGNIYDDSDTYPN